MTETTNNWVKELLSWHGHDLGGVHVPFQNTNPLGSSPIKTGLIERLRVLSGDIASGKQNLPRWVFLIGGPGNGKSETVQDFLSTLDKDLGLNGDLVSLLAKSYTPRPLVPRRVEIKTTDLPNQAEFRNKVGRIIIVQDATATDSALGNSARHLFDDILDLMTTAEDPPPVFVACANRGLLARCLKEAQASDLGREVTQLLESIIQASSLGVTTLVDDKHRPGCWPLDDWPQVACWPLDLESLLVPLKNQVPPIDQILRFAIDINKWEHDCDPCSAKNLCPFLRNVTWLRDEKTRNNLLKILRRGELYLGQRWNFRDSFSLVAEIIVGQWTDFGDCEHPCAWVHEQEKKLTTGQSPLGISEASLLLTRRLYPHALFPYPTSTDILSENLALISEHLSTQAILSAWDNLIVGSVKSIRERLSKDYAPLDPALFTPKDPGHVLRLIENDYSQSVQQGNSKQSDHDLFETERILLATLEDAEKEWNIDLLGRNAFQALKIVAYLRMQAALLVKRSVGVRLGFHASEDYLEEYAQSIHDRGQLQKIIQPLKKLLGEDKFRFNVLESFGQPQAENRQFVSEEIVSLVDDIPGILVYPAPLGTGKAPQHDVPFFTIKGNGYPVPLTFDFYLALRLRQEGCASSSLPASVRAAVDRVKQQLAGKLCRNRDAFIMRTAAISITNKYSILLNDDEAEPILEIA